MKKIDLRKELKQFFKPSAKKVEVVDVPDFNFAMIDGQIEAGSMPGNSTGFQEAMGALFGMSYTLKFMSKLREVNPIDYPVMAVEGLWWVEGGEFDINKPGEWRYTLMMLQPDHITAEMFEQARRKVKEKRDSAALAKVRLERFHEGLCMQIMHVGPYADEPATIETMQAFAREGGYSLRGKHHEIYLGDPRKTKPENLKTVLRQPI